jgi:6-phosphogluconolactonase
MHLWSNCGASLVLGLALLSQPAHARDELAYIGTFTNANPARPPQIGNRGEGIYVTRLDSVTGKLTAPRLAVATPSPSWLVIDRTRGVLFAANYYRGFTDPKEPRGTGTVSAFRIDKTSGELMLINQVSVADAPAHIALDPSGRWMVVASYDYGSVVVLPVGIDGTLGAYTDLIRPQSAPAPDQAADQPEGNQSRSSHDHSRMHGVYFDPSGKFVVINDAGQDTTNIFTLDGSAGKLVAVGLVRRVAGSAPRHSVFSPNGHILYTLFEQDSKVSVDSFDPRTGSLTPRQRLSTLPNGFAGTAAAAEILLSKDGRNLYISNRFHDSIAHFAVNPDGTLQYRGDVASPTSVLRGLSIDPSGRWLVAAGQNNDSMTVFRLDTKTGTPIPTSSYAAVLSPVAIAFVEN